MLALLVPALLPLLVTVSPELYFQFDPRLLTRGYSLTELGPAGAAWLCVYSVAAAGAALAVAACRGVRISALLLGLAGLGMAACAVHIVGGSLADRTTAGAWLAGAALAVGAAHLGQLPDARRWAGAALLAVTIPVALDAAFYVFVSHPMTVETYMATRDQTLASRGWAPGSAEAIKYEQRLRANDATGAFGLSNVLGSFAAVFTLAGLTLGVLTLRAKRWASVAVAGGLAALGGLTLYLTQSKGAMAAAVAGVVMLGATLACAGRPRRRAAAGALALLLVAGALALVLARGAMGPPGDAQGERSILFRYHYLQGVANLLRGESPRAVLLGVGPDGFGQLYPRYKNPISPESVTSAHNVFADWAAMLGVGGVALGAVLGVLLWRGASALRPTNKDAAQPGLAGAHRVPRPVVVAAAALAAVLFGTEYVVSFAALGPASGVVWLVGLLGFVVVLVALARRCAVRDAAWPAVALVAGVVLLVHGQIVMTFYNLAAVGPACFIVGLAGAGAAPDARRLTGRATLRYAPACVLVLAAILLASGNAALVSRQQAQVASAEDALRRGDWQDAVEHLDRSAALIPADNKAVRWRVALRMEMAMELARHGMTGPARARLDGVFAILDDAQRAGLSPPQAERYRAQTHRLAATLLGDPDAPAYAAQAMRRAADLSPYNTHLHLDAADFALAAGDSAAAAAPRRQTLALHDAASLDPAHQLSPEDHARVTSTLGTLDEADPGK